MELVRFISYRLSELILPSDLSNSIELLAIHNVYGIPMTQINFSWKSEYGSIIALTVSIVGRYRCFKFFIPWYILNKQHRA